MKIRRTSIDPLRYGTIEIAAGDELDVGDGTAEELLAAGGWELVPTTPASDHVQDVGDHDLEP